MLYLQGIGYSVVYDWKYMTNSVSLSLKQVLFLANTGNMIFTKCNKNIFVSTLASSLLVSL